MICTAYFDTDAFLYGRTLSYQVSLLYHCDEPYNHYSGLERIPLTSESGKNEKFISNTGISNYSYEAKNCMLCDMAHLPSPNIFHEFSIRALATNSRYGVSLYMVTFKK